jgi:hypothetical protein
MDKMSSFISDVGEEVTGILIQRRPANYQAIIEIQTKTEVVKLLAENTIYRSPNCVDLHGLELYIVNLDFDTHKLVTDDLNSIVLPPKIMPFKGLYKGMELGLTEKGAAVTNIKPYHIDWDLKSQTHIYVFGDYEVHIDIGPLHDFIFKIVNKNTGEVKKY